MSGLQYARALAPAALVYIFSTSVPALAQSAPDLLPDIVVTATRGPLEAARAGSAITVITAADIEKTGAKSLVEALRAAPGVDVRENGGVGSRSNASLRGATPGQTLVLVDGVRVGDPTGTDGALDFGALAIGDVERIEVLRGPQSALYGSDAMGGVINIITRRGGDRARRSVSLEAGSYGTLHARGAASGASDGLSYAFSVDTLHADGFARYVDRDAVRAGFWPRVPRSDPTDRVGVAGRVGYRFAGGTEVEVGGTAQFNRLTFDNPFALVPANIYDRSNVSRQWTGSLFARASHDAFDGRLKNRLVAFATSMDRSIAETESCPDFLNFPLPASNCVSKFRGQRYGAEYQGDLKLDRLGLLTFGARTETETATTSQTYPAGYAGPLFNGISARQTTNSVFALHQFTLGDAMDLSLGGRVDAVSGGRSFPTWRGTWAYRFTQTGTKLRASAGTGARAPSLFQRFSEYGDRNLAPETNVGVDAGIDQILLDGRVTLSATAFHTRYRDLIDFRFLGCAPTQFNGCYYNVGRAEMNGAEISADAILAPDAWRVRASYTHLVAKNATTGVKLLQRPRHKGVVSLIYTGRPGLELEGRATFVGSRADFGGFAPIKLPAWARFDAFATYKLNDTFSLFGRVENIAGTKYEDVFNYVVAGRSVYAGLKATW